ncbi:MAG: hypothetical protein WCX97_05365 [Candidatus Magasanikbacteria bacterium]|jgi:hypothetical protein
MKGLRGRPISIFPENVEFNGTAFKLRNREVKKSKSCGFLSLTKRFIGRRFDIILVPKDINQFKEVENETEENNEIPTENS